MIKGKIISLIFYSLFLFPTAFAYQGEELLSVFSSSCPGQGSWTQKALAQSQALISALESIRDDKNCASLAGSLSDLENLSTHIATLNAWGAQEQEAIAHQAKVDALLAEISSTSDPIYISSLQSYLMTAVAEQTYYQSIYQSPLNTSYTPISTSISTLVAGTEAMISQLVAQKQCLVSHPQILASAASLVGAVAGGIAMVNPILGIGISGGSLLMGLVIEGSRQGAFAGKINTVSELTTEAESYRCVLESLSNQWCEINDARNLVREKSKKLTEAKAILPQGMKLLEVSMPVLVKWLGDVRAGNTASSLADSERQSVAIERQAMVQKALAKGQGLINENRDLFSSYTDDRDKWSVLRQLILAITGTGQNINYMSGSNVSNPMEEIYPDNYSPYYLLGIALKDFPTNDNGDQIPFQELDPFEKLDNFSPNYLLLETQYKLWVSKAQLLASKQLDLVLRPDPLVILSSYFDFTDNKNKISPAKALADFLQYTDSLLALDPIVPPGWSGNGPFIKLLNEVRHRLYTIDMAVKGSLSNDPTMSERQAIEVIFKQAQLEFGTGIISAHIEIPLKQIIWKEITSLGPEQANLAAMFMVGNSIKNALTTIDGTESLTLQLDDLKRSSAMAISTLDGMVNVFGKNINQILKKIKQEEKKNQGALGDDYQSMRANICLRLLTLPSIPKNIETKLCDGASLEQALVGGPIAPEISTQTWALPHEERACMGRNFFRASKIYQDLEQ